MDEKWARIARETGINRESSMFYLVEIASCGGEGSKWLKLEDRKFLIGY
jgi:hypothetical protein